MLAQVAKADRGGDPVVFLGWEPHPMNANFELTYLEGGDDWFGPNLGGATVYTNTSAGYSESCPNVGKLLNNLGVQPCDGKSRSWAQSLTTGRSPKTPRPLGSKANPGVLDGWLAGVTTKDGGDAMAAVKSALGHVTLHDFASLPRPWGWGALRPLQEVPVDWLIDTKIPVGGRPNWALTGCRTISPGSSTCLSDAMEDRFWPHRVAFASATRIRHHRSVRCPHLDHSTKLEILPDRVRRIPVHSESGVLDGNHGKPDVGSFVLHRLHGARSTHRNRGGASPQALPGDAPDTRPDADPADVRLSDTDRYPVRHRRLGRA